MAKNISALDIESPVIPYDLPESDPTSPSRMLESESIMYDLIALALQSGLYLLSTEGSCGRVIMPFLTTEMMSQRSRTWS